MMTDDVTQPETNDAERVEGPEVSVQVRRNVSLSASVGGLSGLLTVAFAARAFTGGTALDWAGFGILTLITLIHVAALADSRAPLLIADPRGVRVRQGAAWQGIAWPEIDCLEHLPRRGLRDGHLLIDGYDDQQLLVPLTLATRLRGASAVSLSDVLAELADERADVVEVVPGLEETSAPQERTSVPRLSDLYADEEPVVVPAQQQGIAARVAAGFAGVLPSRDVQDEAAPDESATVADGEVDVEVDVEDAQDTGDIDVATEHDEADQQDTGEIVEAPEPGRPTVFPARVELTASERTPLPTADGAPEQDSVTVVLDDLAVRPAANPVIGPDLAAARERLRLSIDQLSERTRIRPHVIESIELDDFGPCGGDFYARGHLRTLARVLGIDATPLVSAYDEHYAHAPVDPRRVFESELATGTGAIRGTRGGRNWSVMIAAVMGVVLVWSVARLVMGGADPVSDAPQLNQSGGISNVVSKQADAVTLRLTAVGGGAVINVRDGAGEIVFDGNLAFGQTSELSLVPPARIFSSDGSVTYALGKSEPKPLGETGVEVSKTLVAR